MGRGAGECLERVGGCRSAAGCCEGGGDALRSRPEVDRLAHSRAQARRGQLACRRPGRRSLWW